LAISGFRSAEAGPPAADFPAAGPSWTGGFRLPGAGRGSGESHAVDRDRFRRGPRVARAG